jgi:hypothetical protein
MAEMSDYLENKILDYVLRNTADWAPATIYLALHTADPTDVTSVGLSNEVDVARQACAFDAAHATTGVTQNTDVETFSSMPAVTVTHVGLWDHVSAGNLLFHTAVAASKAVASGDTITVAAGAVTVTLA